MAALYRCLLRLYPAGYFREYADEMTAVFSSAEAAVRHESFGARTLFYARETWGALRGALGERCRSRAWHSIGRFEMRPSYRFPRSTLFMMLLILAGVIMAIQKGMSVSLASAAGAGAPSPWSLLSLFLAPFLLIFAFVAVDYAILFALRRSGTHRLSNVRAWPGRR